MQKQNLISYLKLFEDENPSTNLPWCVQLVLAETDVNSVHKNTTNIVTINKNTYPDRFDNNVSYMIN